MTPIASVVFDVDGVLVNSLEAHLRICRDKSEEFGLHLAIPTASELKQMLRRGAVISPMKNFFLTIGFPEPLAERADVDYQREFVRKYAPGPFPTVPEMLQRIAQSSVLLGIVTSNTLANVSAALGSAMRWFDPGCLSDRDSRATKAEALTHWWQRLGIDPESVLYVGDQYQDRDAARQARTSFLGVTYGWGIDETDVGFAKAGSPEAIARYVFERRGKQ